MSKQTDLINVTDAITVSGSNVGINTSSPNSYYAKKLVVDCGTDGQNGITIKSSTTGAGMFAFADGTSGSDRYRGYINYNHANDSMTLGTAGGAGVLTIDATGAVTMPHQPAFLAVSAVRQSNIPVGGSALTTVVFGNEKFDQNADFSPSTFTAPVTGKYQFNVHVRLENVDISAAYYQLHIRSSNEIVAVDIISPKFTADLTYFVMQGSILLDMDASDTAYVTIFQSGGAAQTDIDAGNDTAFSGYLVA